MSQRNRPCPDCSTETNQFDRREFLKAAAAATALAGGLPILDSRANADEASSAAAPETLVKSLYDSLSEMQPPSASTGTFPMPSGACCGRGFPTTG
jgi:hypothetical protein